MNRISSLCFHATLALLFPYCMPAHAVPAHPMVRPEMAQPRSLLLEPHPLQLYALEQNGGQLYQPQKRPSIGVDDIAGEILAGALVGVLTGAAVLYLNVKMTEPHEGFSDMSAALTGFAVGYCLGSAIGVYSIGSVGPHTGDFVATLLGSAVGTLLFILPAPVGATVGFNATLRYDTPPPPENGLIDLRDGRVCYSLPAINLDGPTDQGPVINQQLTVVLIRVTLH